MRILHFSAVFMMDNEFERVISFGEGRVCGVSFRG